MPELKDQPGTRVLKCTDAYGSSSRYAVDDMTRKLVRFPSLAASIGLTSVSNCDEAISYAGGYDEYSGRNPGFEERPDPKWSGNPPTVDDRAILPRIKVKGGGKTDTWAFPTKDHPGTSPGPVVKIESVSWWPNGQEQIFHKTAADGIEYNANQFCEISSSCTAFFINRSWLLTAAHCMQNVNKFPVTYNPVMVDGLLTCQYPSEPNPASTDPKYPQTGDHNDYLPGKDMHASHTGVARYVISWPANGDYPNDANQGVYSVRSNAEEIYYGVGLYQFPHEQYDPTQGQPDLKQPENVGSPIRRGPDVALLSMANWTSAAEYMAPDLDNEAAMYIKGKPTSATGNPGAGLTFWVAGYGYNPAQNDGALYDGVLTGNVTFTADWQDQDTNNRFGGFGSVSMNVTSLAEVIVCSGDSGSPLYTVFTPVDGGPRKFIAYAVHSGAYQAPPDDGRACSKPPGDILYWSRIEADDRLRQWMNVKMANGPIATTEDEQGKYNQCQPMTDAVNGLYYKCWGDPCDGLDKDGSSLSKMDARLVVPLIFRGAKSKFWS